MLLDIEHIIDGSVGRREPLGGALGFELLLLSFASSDRQMRVLGLIVRTQSARAVSFGQSELAHRGAI